MADDEHLFSPPRARTGEDAIAVGAAAGRGDRAARFHVNGGGWEANPARFRAVLAILAVGPGASYSS
jgi:hypothetical protein